MKILLTNDDGYKAEGINTLFKYLANAGHEVWMIAPHKNRSATSCHITMNSPLRIKKHGEHIYSTSGMPADCTMLAIKSNILGGKPDVVVSGINEGGNIGTDILYSGTASAARQAVISGVPGIALSVYTKDSIYKYDAMAKFAVDNLEKLASLSIPAYKDKTENILKNTDCVFVNVNGKSCDKYIGAKYADKLSFRQYNDTIHLISAPDGDMYSFFGDGEVVTHGEENSDNIICKNGYISVSCVYAAPQALKYVDRIYFSV